MANSANQIPQPSTADLDRLGSFLREPFGPRIQPKPEPKPFRPAIVETLPGRYRTKYETSVSHLGKLRRLLSARLALTTFLAIVVAPSISATFYMTFIAENQFDSEAAFSIRSISSSAPTDILGMFAQASGGNSRTDSFILSDFILGESLMSKADEQFGLDSIFRRHGYDFFFGLQPGSSVEAKLRYWQSMVSVSFDGTSGIIYLSIRTFDPLSSQRLAEFIVSESDALINSLSNDARDGVLGSAYGEVKKAELRLTNARSAIQRYRENTQEVDPTTAAALSNSLVATLEQQLSSLSAEMLTARTQMSDDAPRVRLLRTQIDSLRNQIVSERDRIGSRQFGDGANQPVAQRISDFAMLQTEEDFSQRAYTAALESLERARIDSTSRQNYLAVFLKPTLSQDSEYPRRVADSAIVFLGVLFLWAVMAMAYGNIRDRA